MSIPRLLALFALLFSAASAAPLTRELGRGLVFHRVHSLPGDLPTTESTRKQPCVLDLRYVHADEAEVLALQSWLRFHASLHTPVFVLANAETDHALLAFPGPRGVTASVVVIGNPASGFTPDIAVATSAENERRAYDALEAGAEPATLMTEVVEKTRNDEASLSRDHPAEPAADDSKSRPTPPPIDAALQRAVHLHRALVALKKI